MNDLTKYFFNRCFELLHKRAFDTYRVSLHNPYTILRELEKSIEKFNKKRIKHYDPTITSIGEEAKLLIDIDYIEEILVFKTFTKKHVIEILNDKCMKGKIEYNKTISLMCKSVLSENNRFTKRLFERITELLNENIIDNSFKVDKYASWLITQLHYRGYSRKFINNRFRKSHELINKGDDLTKTFDNLCKNFSIDSESYKTIFKLKSESIKNIKFASQTITNIEKLPEVFENAEKINAKFKELEENEIYVEIEIKAFDFWSALKLSHEIISESIEINILHKTENRIILENQALIYHNDSKSYRMETIEDSLDGHYDYNEVEFNRFIENYKNIKSSVAKEKIRSAIRFYKLGNDSLEIEHIILNYWIGFEQLFAAVESNEDSINRMKNFYVYLSCCYYLQRRTNYLLVLADLKRYKNKNAQITLQDLKNPLIADLTFIDRDPLLEKRIKKYINDYNSNHGIKESIKLHKKRLELHLTRIYKIRNELIHEGKTTGDLNLVASHLRHYLLFSIEQITNELNENEFLEHLDDVFIYYENLFLRIIESKNLDEIFAIKEFKGYME
jgi:hypothetical protein